MRRCQLRGLIAVGLVVHVVVLFEAYMLSSCMGLVVIVVVGTSNNVNGIEFQEEKEFVVSSSSSYR